jgi:hypothetical protein
MQFRFKIGIAVVAVLLAGACQTTPDKKTSDKGVGYAFERSYPAASTIQSAFDDSELARAVQAYKFFYPTVSGAAMFKGNAKIGVIPNKAFGKLDTKPEHVGFTLNSDTPYAPIPLDLSIGPMVIELQPGPLIVVAMDINQRWVADMGIPGPDAGKGAST